MKHSLSLSFKMEKRIQEVKWMSHKTHHFKPYAHTCVRISATHKNVSFLLQTVEREEIWQFFMLSMRMTFKMSHYVVF